jgi:deferrochelatase/peroxidase EfeB
MVAFHSVRNLARIGHGAVVLRWTQLGFGRTSSTTSSQSTPRNLQGFKDCTNNIHDDDAAAMSRYVWVGDEEPQAWFRGGSYLVARRGHSFTDGVDPSTGELDAGLFFIAFQRDPTNQFAAIQTRLGASDGLDEYVVHTGGGLFAVPPGARPGGFVGEGLFA